MRLFPSNVASLKAGTVAPPLYTGTITVKAGAITGTLNNYVVSVRLSSLPVGFWNTVRTDVENYGGNIRIYSGVTRLPLDISRFDPVAKDGVIWFKAPTAAVGSAFTITCEASTATQPAANQAYGSQAVWSNYESVFLFGESNRDRTGKSPLYVGSRANFFVADPVTYPVIGYQGITQLANKTWLNAGTVELYVYSEDFSTILGQNLTPFAGVGLPGATDHISDPGYCPANGKTYAVTGYYAAGTSHSHRLCTVAVNGSNIPSLTLLADIQPYVHECSSITYCDRDGLLYATCYTDQNILWKFDLNGNYMGSLTLTYNTAVTVQIQGITWWKGAFWITADSTFQTYRVEYNGQVQTTGLYRQPGTTENEGIGYTPDYLVNITRLSGSSTIATKFRPYDTAKSGGGGVEMATTSSFSDRLDANGRASLTTFTMGLTAQPANVSTINRVPMTYRNVASAGVDRRVAMARRNTGGKWATWDSASLTWLDSPITPVINTPYRLHAGWSPTDRIVAVDGVTTHGAGVALPNDLDGLLFFQADEDSTNFYVGQIGFAYLYPALLSDAWIAAESLMLTTPTSFYQIS